MQLFLNLVKTGFIGGIPVDKLPQRLYNGTGELREGICYVTAILASDPRNLRPKFLPRKSTVNSSYFIQ